MANRIFKKKKKKKMNIYSPSYNGNHTLKQYIEMGLDLTDKIIFANQKESLFIDIDFLHDKEIEHYFDTIFYKSLLNHNHNCFVDIYIQSAQKKKIRKIKKILKKYLFDIRVIKMRKGKYNIKVYV